MLVAPWVAAEMTDLLQSAVLSGTGRAAQIGRPVAGKTGTTSSNKDGWFIGFSSGLTTGVWMGRDDARAVAGLQGGTAPARAFHDFMTVAVANRPVEQFETEVPMPDWQLEPDEEDVRRANRRRTSTPLVDENGNPLAGQPADPVPPGGSPAACRRDGTGELDQHGSTRCSPPRQRAAPPPTAPAAAPAAPRSRPPRRPQPAPADPLQPRPERAAIGRAAATSPPNNSRSSALNCGPWSMWTRCATSCATT